MHGRPREYKNKLKADPKAQEAYKKKVDAIRNGTTLVLEYRRQKKYEPAILDAAAKLLKVVPEIYTLWNYRREALEPAFAAGGDEARRATDGELALTQACLMENPKSYSAWHHRKWVVAQGLAPLDREMQLISRALDEDQRNFHAWNYRQFVCRRMGRSAQDELQYCEDKILQNFSNYSAWHSRTILLHQMYCGGAGAGADSSDPAVSAVAGCALLEAAAAAVTAGDAGSVPEHGLTSASVVGTATRGSASQRSPIPYEVLDQEYDMVHQAFATDSRDESPWMYYRWLVGNTLAHLGPQTERIAAFEPSAAAQPATAYAQPEAEEPKETPAEAPITEAPPGRSVGEARGPAAGIAPGTGPGAGGAVGLAAAPDSAAEADTAAAAESRARVAAVLEREAARLLEDHLAAEPDAKWPLLTLARLREAQARLGLAGGPEECAELLAEARSLYGRLMEVDPMRRGYYQDALEGRAFVVVQALGTV